MRRLAAIAAVSVLMAVFAAGGGAEPTIANCGAETDPATNVTTTTATLNGTLGVGSLADSSACGAWSFDYGTSAEYGSSTMPGEPSEGPSVPVSANLTGLTPGTTYHFRLDAQSGAGNLGADVTFQTTPVAPPPPPMASLVLTNTANTSNDTDRSNITFTIVVQDNGSDDATEVTVQDVVPAGLSLVSATANTGGCNGTTTVTCMLGALGNSNHDTVTLVMSPTGSGSITDTATVTATDLAPNSTTSASATVNVSPPPAPATTTTATTTTPAPPTPEQSPGVLINHSIHGISINSTKQQVQEILGQPSQTLELSLPGGKTGTIATYHVHGADFLVTFDSTGHVVSIESYSTEDKTSGGVGPGSPLTKAAALSGFREDFCEFGYWNGSRATKPAAIVTVFTPGDGGLVESVLITQARLYTNCDSASAGAAPVPPVTLAIDHSIGGVSIGMTRAGVVALYGAPSSTLKITLGAGKAGYSVRYRIHGAPLLITYDSSGRVVSIESYSSYFRTAGDLGPGSLLSEVAAAHGFHPDYCELGYWNGTARTRPSHVITVFTPEGGLVASVLITQLRLYTACDAGSTELPPS